MRASCARQKNNVAKCVVAGVIFMYNIISKRPLNAAGTTIEMVVEAPLVARKCLPGQFAAQILS